MVEYQSTTLKERFDSVGYRVMIKIKNVFGSKAQMVERPAVNRRVAGSVSAPLRSALNEGPLDLQRPAVPAPGASSNGRAPVL